MKRWSALVVAGGALLLAGAPLVLAHGDEEEEHHASAAPAAMAGAGDAPAGPANYFRLKQHSGLMLAHIALMVAGWCFLLPIAVVLSVAKSRYTLPSQIVFLVTNGLGLLAGAVYEHSTPQLYAGNKHGPIGWVVSWIVSVWTIASLVALYARSFGGNGNESKRSRSRRRGQPVTAALMARYRRFADSPASPQTQDGEGRRWSGDSGQGTERNSESLYNHSRSPSLLSDNQLGYPSPPIKEYGPEDYEDYEDEYSEDSLSDNSAQGQRGLLGRRAPRVDRFLSRGVRKFTGWKKTLFAVQVAVAVLDRAVLPLGFLAVTTGAIVYGGIFNGPSVFNGLAHFIKGGIFFWYGLLTFGRWMGCNADWGWAWNRRPTRDVVGKWAARVPSAEFLESFTICMYGVTNVGLEHLANTDGEWAATDLEHISITLMFFGGGLLGMMIESWTIRDLLMSNIELARDRQRAAAGPQSTQPSAAAGDASPDLFEEPEQYRLSLNPMPALMICLLGLMMGSHHQASMVSTMIHKQWGNLFMGFAFARLATYAQLYLRGPSGYMPTRPPTEVIASFCLVAGGLLFMFSNKDTVAALEWNKLDAMFVFNVTMGFTAFTLAWAAACMAVKGWAQRREARRTVAPAA